jgi:6-phosphogluconolactonase (cycloisomerase 2 family)
VLGDGSLSPIACSGSACNTGVKPEGIAITPGGKYLYAANANDNTVSVFSVAGDGSLTRVTCPTCGTGMFPEQVGITPNGRFLYVTNGMAGTVSPFSINADGTLAPIACTPLPVSCTDPNVGNLAIAPSGQFLYTSHSGLGDISVFAIGSGGSLTPVTCTNCTANSVAGGLVITPDGRFLYESQYSTGGSIVPFAIHADGTVTQVTCPANDCLAGDHPRGMAITPDGKFLYAAIQTSGGLSQYSINSDGTLTPIACSGTGCQTATGPVTPVVAPGGQRLYVANETSGVVTAYAIGSTGALTQIPCTAPNCNAGSAPLGLALTPDQAPTASFSATPGQPGQPTSFDASASTASTGHTVAHYKWDFGDGTTLADGGVTPTHAYAAAGTYSVTLTVTDDAGCSDTPIFTGQTDSCNGLPRAQASKQVVIPPARALTVTVNGPGKVTGTGISCPGDCTDTYGDGASVTLTASPSDGGSFLGWGGACTGFGACTVTMHSDETLTASFEAAPPPTRPPNTRLTSAEITGHSATFTFTATGDATQFECVLGRVAKNVTAKVGRCHSPKRYRHLAPGKYLFGVDAVGPGGKDKTPATKTFRIR